MKALALRLKQIQEERNLTQRDLAKLVNVTPASLSDYINDRKNPAIDIVERMAKALNVSMGWLCGENQAAANMATYEDLLRNIVELIDGAHGVFISTDYDYEDIEKTDIFPIIGEIGVYQEYAEAKRTFGADLGIRGAYLSDPAIVAFGKIKIADYYNLVPDFFMEWNKMKKLYKSGTIDRELYEVWLEKQFSKYASIKLPRTIQEEEAAKKAAEGDETTKEGAKNAPEE